ncbi:MAG TPA: carboxypeptidase-like regulatory domain-containing protein, partial [Terriglobales bacterium]|nr:carboxypeptidase-like regulatory domain-containing protein [Terriglobales bacterium]
VQVFHPSDTEEEADISASSYRQRSALTDREGHFKFEGLPQMRNTLTVRKPGFFSPNELDRGLPRVNRVEVGATTPAVVLKLVPEAVITGRVTDANGEPLEGVALRISGLQRTNGRRQLQPVGQEQDEPQSLNTNEDGEYRIAGLTPGSYYVAAVPYSSNHDQAQSVGLPKISYPVTYYPGVAELAEAAPVQLSAGQRAEVDFTLRQAPIVVVAGLLTGLPRGQEADLQFLNASGDDIAFDKQFDAQAGTFLAHIVSAGLCVIKADAKDALDHPLHAQVSLNASAGVRNIRLALAPALSIPILVRLETTKPLSATPARGPGAGTLSENGLVAGSIPVSVNLHPIEIGRPDVSASVEGGPNNPLIVLRNLEAGRYKVEVIPNNSENNSWYVKSIFYGGADLFRQELTVAGGEASPMEIVLRDDSAVLHGTVQFEETEGQAAVLVVPDYAPLDPKMTVADDRGEFQIDGLAPGEYKIFAFDRLDGLEYSNPEALGEYASKAAQVSLLPNEKTTVKVDLIQRGE